MNNARSIIFSLLFGLTLMVTAAPTWALDVPEREPLALSSETETGEFTFEIFSNFLPFWKQRLIPLEIPELKRPMPILPETFDTPTLTQRWHRGLLRLPFRPIQIGQEPRLPNDPETGLGLVFRLPVSF
ncbi:MAG: hypothetical protein VX252_08435 [Myxococcota bacterium]|nr:hypothetical protein [Myxococcota bacterium]